MPALITPLPTPPTRSDPTNFSNRADDFLAALPTFQAEANALSAFVETESGLAEVARDQAQTAAADASVYSTLAAGAANSFGAWASLTGSLSRPASVFHAGSFWVLLNDLADVTAHEPGVSGNWAEYAQDFVQDTGGSATNLTIEGTVLNGSVGHEVFALTGITPTINPANGTIQTWTLSGNSTPVDGLSNGQYVVLMIADGTDYAITWPSVMWRTAAPTLKTTGYTVVMLWKVGGTLYGAW